jgi:putative transposase
MSRPLRIQYPDAWYHVMNRGRRGEDVFDSKNDYECFIAVLQEAIELFALRVSAYCLMPNYYHLLVQTPNANLSRCMRHINGVYTQRYNRAHSLDGPLFRGRYKAIVVCEDDFLLQLIRYIHNDPVRSGRVNKAGHYTWSSHKGYLSHAKKWNWLHKQVIFAMLAKQTKQRFKKYQAFMRADEDQTLLRLFNLKKLPTILGDDSSVDKLKSRFYKQKQHIEVPESKRLAPKVEKIKQTICRYYRIDEDQLYYSRRAFFNEARAMGIYLCRHLRGQALKEIGEQFKISNYSTVSSIIERFKVRLQTDRGLSKRVKQVQQAIVKP